VVGRRLEQSEFRVLVADDFEPWRKYACSELRKCDGAYSVHQTADGLETVQKAHELQPDLILLDISLPKMHGIDAARQIHSKCPKSKILFVSEDQSLDVVREALSTGARGYVVKSDGSELLAAVDAVRQGRFFVSKSLAKYSLVSTDLDPSAR
jgi:DNA-binding NarL/FixJ family response regulator